MNNRKKSLNNLIFALLSQVITIGLGLILPRLWIVSYGSEVNGLLGSLNQFLVYLGLFEAGVGTATLQALYKPVAEKNWDDVNGVLSATNKYYHKTGRWYLTGLVALATLYPFIVDSSLSYATIFGAVFFSGIGNVVLFYFQGKYNFLLQADGKAYIFSILSTVIYIVNSLCRIVLILLRVNIVVILAVNFIIQCSQAVYIMWYVKRYYPNVNVHVPPHEASIAQKNFALVHQISSLIFHNTDVMLLTLFCDLPTVSVYSLFKMITSQLETLLNIPLSSVSFVLGQNYQTDKKLYIYRIDLFESFYSSILYALFAVALFLFLPFMRLYTQGVTDANYIDPWLAVLFVLCSLLDRSRAPMLTAISYAGHYQQTLRHTILESTINIVVSVLGVWLLGVYGVLLGTVAALAYRTNNIILYSNHKLLERSAKKTYSIYITNISLFILLQWIFRMLFDVTWIDSYLKFGFAGVICTVLAVSVLGGAQIILFPDCRIMAKNMIHRFLSKK